MSKNIKNIIIASIVLVVLAGVLIALKLTEGGEEKTPEVTTTTEKANENLSNYTGLNVTVTDIVSVDIKNPKAEYTILNSGGKCTIEGLNYDFNSSIIDTIPSNALTATIINKPSGTGDYGFDTPQAEYTINFTNNRSVNVIIGNKAINESETYVKLNENVFTVSSYILTPYTEDTLYYLSTVVYPAPADEADKKIDSVTIQLENAEYDDIKISKRNDLHSEMAFSPYEYMLTSPVNATLNKVKAVSYINPLFGLTADKVVDVYDKAAGYSPYRTELLGKITFVNPNIILDIYKAPEDSDLDYYVFTDNSDFVYGFTALTITDNEGETAPKLPWLEIDPEEIVSVFTISELQIWQYRSLLVELPNKKFDFQFNASGEKDTFTVELNGETFNRDRFQKFNAFLLDGYIDKGNFNPSKGNSIAKITITMGYGEVYTVEYFEDTSNVLNVIAYVNGSPLGTLNVGYKTALIKNLSILTSEETFASRK